MVGHKAVGQIDHCELGTVGRRAPFGVRDRNKKDLFN